MRVLYITVPLTANFPSSETFSILQIRQLHYISTDITQTSLLYFKLLPFHVAHSQVQQLIRHAEIVGSFNTGEIPTRCLSEASTPPSSNS